LTLTTAIVIDQAHHCYLVHISGAVNFQMALYSKIRKKWRLCIGP